MTRSKRAFVGTPRVGGLKVGDVSLTDTTDQTTGWWMFLVGVSTCLNTMYQDRASELEVFTTGVPGVDGCDCN